jgi:hypothetical protein
MDAGTGHAAWCRQDDTETKMKTRQILELTPRFGESESIAPQPSLADIVREHYRRMFGDAQGDIIADMYVETVIGMAGSAEGQATPPETESAIRPTAPAEADTTAADRFVQAMVAKHDDETVESLHEKYLLRRIVAVRLSGRLNGVLAAEFAAGGLPNGAAELDAQLKRMVERKMIARDGGFVMTARPSGTTPERASQTIESTAAAAGVPPEQKPARPEAGSAAQGIDAVFKGLGLDMKIGGYDLGSGIETAAKSGSAIPLATGLAGAILGVIVAAEGNKRK